MNRAEKQSQKLFKKTLIHRCDVFIKTRTRVGSQWQEVFVRSVEAAPCRMSTPSPGKTEKIELNQQQFQNTYTLYSLPMDIKQDARVLLYTERSGSWVPEAFYEVKARPRDPSFVEHHYESSCEIMEKMYDVITTADVTYLGV